MSENKPKFNYQVTAEIQYTLSPSHTVHIAINGIGDTEQAAKDLFDHGLDKFKDLIEGALNGS